MCFIKRIPKKGHISKRFKKSPKKKILFYFGNSTKQKYHVTVVSLISDKKAVTQIA